MAKGTVKWFNDSKGFGFIAQGVPGPGRTSTTRRSPERVSRPSPRVRAVEFEITQGRGPPTFERLRQSPERFHRTLANPGNPPGGF